MTLTATFFAIFWCHLVHLLFLSMHKNKSGLLIYTLCNTGAKADSINSNNNFKVHSLVRTKSMPPFLVN